MQDAIKTLVLMAILMFSGCSRTYIYEENECIVKEQKEDGTLVMECYDKSLKKESHRDPKESK